MVIDSVNNSPLGYVTVVLHESMQTQPFNTAFSHKDGSFEFRGVSTRVYELTLSYVGYRTKTLQLSPTDSKVVDLGIISLSPIATQLKEVQVTAQKPLIEQSLDKTIYHAEADPDVDLLNSFDLLRKVPHLAIDAEDNITLNGQQNYQILVNGKRSAIFSSNPAEVLKGLPANAIKQIEIITNPSARYEAAGTGGIINIITHKRSISGYNGSLSLIAGAPENYTGNATATGTAGKVSLTGRYSNNYTSRPGNTSSFYRHDKIREGRLEQVGSGSGKSRSQNIGSELSFDVSPQDQLALSFNLNNNSGTNSHNQQVTQKNTTGTLTEAYQNINSGKNESNTYDLNLGYQRHFQDNSSRSLSIDLNLIKSENFNVTEFTLQPLLNYQGRESNTQNRDGLREHNLQADYTQPLGEQTLEVGIRSILQENSSDYFYKNMDQETGVFVLDPSMSNSFDYRQDIHAAYASLNLRKDKWGLRTGLRLEETRLKANFRSSATKATQQYRYIFPNITITRMLHENGSLKLSYNQRIQRPSLYDLNPYVEATDPLNISYGNPGLAPATSHSLQLDFNRHINSTSFNASLSHHFTNNTIQYFTILGEDSVARSTYGNLGRDRRYSLLLSSNTTIAKKLSLNVQAMANYISYRSSIEGNAQDREGFTYNARANASYRFAKGWRASGNISYNSPNLMLQGRTAGYMWSSISLSKQFLKDEKATISLSIRSPFEKYRRSASEVDNPAFYQLRESYSLIRQYNASFNYRFGKLR